MSERPVPVSRRCPIREGKLYLTLNPEIFKALSVAPVQFLLNDFVLLGAAIWSLGESLDGDERSIREQPTAATTTCAT